MSWALSATFFTLLRTVAASPTEQSQHYQTNAHSLTPKYFAASAGGMSFAKRPIMSAVNACLASCASVLQFAAAQLRHLNLGKKGCPLSALGNGKSGDRSGA